MVWQYRFSERIVGGQDFFFMGLYFQTDGRADHEEYGNHSNGESQFPLTLLNGCRLHCAV
jgi:hypothetical protein